jgi:hypothetical protein
VGIFPENYVRQKGTELIQLEIRGDKGMGYFG